MSHFVNELGIFLKFFERAHAEEVASLHAVMTLRAGEVEPLASFVDFNPRPRPRRIGRL